MWLELELDRLMLSPLRPKRPLPQPAPEDVQLARELGFVGPITARPSPGTHPARYEIISGENQWLTAQKAGLATVSVRVRRDLANDDVARLLAQPDDRAVDPLQEALALRARVRGGASVTRAGAERGYPRVVASHLLRLLRLDPAVRTALAEGRLTVGHAKALVGLSPAHQRELGDRIARDGLSVRHVERLARDLRAGASGRVEPVVEPGDDPDSRRLEQRLEEHLGVPVRLRARGDGSGQLTLEFGTLDILAGLLDRLGYRDEPE